MAHREDIPVLDAQIEKLMRNEKLEEAEVKELCEKVHGARALCVDLHSPWSWPPPPRALGRLARGRRSRF